MRPVKPETGHRIRNILLLTLLAVVCIAGTELAFCRVEDPAVYERIVAPVRQVYQGAVNGVEAGYTALRTKVEDWERSHKKPREEAVESQLAGDPAVEGEYVPADHAVTELVMTETGEYLTGGLFPLPYYNQADELWASESFGVDPIGEYGCGPTALAMAVSALTEETVNPAEMAAWAGAEGYAAPHSGSYFSIVEGCAEHYGLDCLSLEGISPEELGRTLSMTEGLVVALMGPGHFTKGGHFILLHGTALSGELLVADPNSRERSVSTWDPELIVSELTATRANGSPLWLLTLHKDPGAKPILTGTG